MADDNETISTIEKVATGIAKGVAESVPLIGPIAFAVAEELQRGDPDKVVMFTAQREMLDEIGRVKEELRKLKDAHGAQGQRLENVEASVARHILIEHTRAYAEATGDEQRTALRRATVARFDAAAGDVAFREYAWRVVRSLSEAEIQAMRWVGDDMVYVDPQGRVSRVPPGPGVRVEAKPTDALQAFFFAAVLDEMGRTREMLVIAQLTGLRASGHQNKEAGTEAQYRLTGIASRILKMVEG